MSRFHERLEEIKKLGKHGFTSIKIDEIIVTLTPIDDSDETVKLITEWRKKYANNFLTKFPVTEERTKKWIQDQTIKNPDRIQFLIIYNEKIIGQYGISQYKEDENSVEPDYAIKGVRIKSPLMMEKIEKALMKWMFEDLNLSLLRMRLFSDNAKSLNWHEKCGMITVDVLPLKRIFTDDGWKWESTIMKNEEDFPERYLTVMEMNKNEYLKKMKCWNV